MFLPRQIVGSNSSALETAFLLRDIITNARFSSGEELIRMVREIGKRLIRAQPVGNILNLLFLFHF